MYQARLTKNSLQYNFNGLEFYSEVMFHHKRRWRFDYACSEHGIAIEVEGGVYTNGRHVRSTGYVKDMEKYNYASALGWHIIRVTPDQFELYEHVKFIDMILDTRSRMGIV